MRGKRGEGKEEREGVEPWPSGARILIKVVARGARLHGRGARYRGGAGHKIVSSHFLMRLDPVCLNAPEIKVAAAAAARSWWSTAGLVTRQDSAWRHVVGMVTPCHHHCSPPFAPCPARNCLHARLQQQWHHGLLVGWPAKRQVPSDSQSSTGASSQPWYTYHNQYLCSRSFVLFRRLPTVAQTCQT